MMALAGAVAVLFGALGDVAPRPLADPAAWFQRRADARHPWPHHWPGESVVAFRVAVGEDGRVAECVIVESTGYDSLDRATCEALTLYGRFAPALDADGRAVRGEWSGRTRWTDGGGAAPEPPQE